MTAIIVSDKIKVPEGQENNPCVGCGACCAYFRASFYWKECVSGGGTVPDDTVVQVGQHLVAMKGTDSSKAPYCINLTGTIGKDAFAVVTPLVLPLVVMVFPLPMKMVKRMNGVIKLGPNMACEN